MRSWLYQRMYSSTKASTSLRVCSSHFSGWTASVFILPKNPSAAALSGEQPFALMERVSPKRSMSPSHPGHRQWHPRSECTRGRAFPGSVEAAFSGIRLASSALGLKPAVYATILPSKQSTGGERHALPVPGLDLADVRQPLLVRTLGREVPVDEIGGSRRRLALVGTIPASLGHVRHEPFLRHDPADRLLRYAGLEHRLDPAVPVPALGIGERPGHLCPESGVLVNAEPGVVAVGGRWARWLFVFN